MPEEPKGDRIWLVLCTATGVAVDVTLNKYSSLLPDLVVMGLWAILLVLFALWIWRVEKTNGWVKHRFLEHPVSYIVMFLIFVPFAWQATTTMISKLRLSEPKAQMTESTRETNKPIVTTPNQVSVALAPTAPMKPPVTTVVVKPRVKATEQQATPPIGQAPATPSPLVAQTPTYEQKCEGSACAQGPGSQVTLNQFGAPKLVMTAAQRDAIRDAMRPFAGMVVGIVCNNATEDSMEYANQLSKALNDAGLKAGQPNSAILFPSPGHAIPSGVMLSVGDDAIPAASVLAKTMSWVGLISKPIPASHSTGKAEFEITISPNR